MEATMDRIEVTHHQIHSPGESRTPDFFEAMLRDDERVDEWVQDEASLLGTIQKLLALGVSGLVIYGLAMGIVMELAKPQVLIQGTPVLWVPLALVGGFLGAIAICLPSFYFYTQLAGLDASFRLITAQSLRVQARASVILLGVLPFYIAWALAGFLGIEVLAADLELVIVIGFLVPFLVGNAGLLSIYRSFRRLVHRLPITHRRRGNVVLRMVLCWGAVVLAIAPVAIYRLAEFLSQII
ncbi:MAG: hypothetical protein ACNA8W_14000 [Bradymonadaceae bacterium]